MKNRTLLSLLLSVMAPVSAFGAPASRSVATITATSGMTAGATIRLPGEKPVAAVVPWFQRPIVAAASKPAAIPSKPATATAASVAHATAAAKPAAVIAATGIAAPATPPADIKVPHDILKLPAAPSTPSVGTTTARSQAAVTTPSAPAEAARPVAGTAQGAQATTAKTPATTTATTTKTPATAAGTSTSRQTPGQPGSTATSADPFGLDRVPVGKPAATATTTAASHGTSDAGSGEHSGTSAHAGSPPVKTDVFGLRTVPLETHSFPSTSGSAAGTRVAGKMEATATTTAAARAAPTSAAATQVTSRGTETTTLRGTDQPAPRTTATAGTRPEPVSAAPIVVQRLPDPIRAPAPTRTETTTGTHTIAPPPSERTVATTGTRTTVTSGTETTRPTTETRPTVETTRPTDTTTREATAPTGRTDPAAPATDGTRSSATTETTRPTTGTPTPQPTATAAGREAASPAAVEDGPAKAGNEGDAAGACRSEIFDCARAAAFPLPSRPHSWARLDDRHLVFLFDVVSTNVADRSRETRPALGFFRATDRAFGACLLAGDAPGVMLSANLSGQADVQTGDIVLGGSDQIAVLSDVPARLADPAFRWGTLADIGTAMKLCHDVGLQTGPPWQAAAGERIFDVARHADAKGQRDILLVLAGSGPAGKEEIRLIRLAKAEGGLAWNMQATILPPSALPAPQALRIRIEPDEGDAARVLVGTAGVAVRIRCTLDEHAAVQDCAEEKSEVPVFASKGKGWDARLLFFGAGKWKGHAAGALPVEAIGFGMGTFLRRTEKVGHTEIRDIDHHDLLLVATKRAVRLVRVIDGIPVVADREVYPCAGEGCAGQSLPPLPIMTDAKGGMDLAYLAESTLHLLPNRLEAPAARVLVHDRTLMADRVCAYGEECSCTWVLADANGTDLSFLLESPTECVTGIKQSSEAETPDAAVSQVGRIVKSLVLATAHAAMQYKVQLTVSNQDFTTRTTAEMSDGTQNALVINAAAGEMAPRAELQAALVEKGLISSETAVIDLGGKAAVAEQPMTAGGTIGTSTPDATTRDATANGTTVDTATLPAEDSPDGARYAVTDEANPMAGGGACALVAYPYPMRPLTLGFWLIFCLPLAIVWPLRACVVARNRSRRRWRNSQHRSAVSR